MSQGDIGVLIACDCGWKMKITVTEDDIKHGIRGYPDRCPVALAVSRETGHFDVFVDGDIHFYMFDMTFSRRCVSKFVERFDHGKPVKPFSFNIPMFKMPRVNP